MASVLFDIVALRDDDLSSGMEVLDNGLFTSVFKWNSSTGGPVPVPRRKLSCCMKMQQEGKSTNMKEVPLTMSRFERRRTLRRPVQREATSEVTPTGIYACRARTRQSCQAPLPQSSLPSKVCISKETTPEDEDISGELEDGSFCSVEGGALSTTASDRSLSESEEEVLTTPAVLVRPAEDRALSRVSSVLRSRRFSRRCYRHIATLVSAAGSAA